MRIVVDLQGCQAVNRFRGIGRYSLSFTKALVRNRGEHEVFLALNGLFAESIEYIRAEFNELLPQKNIYVWYPPAGFSCKVAEDKWRCSVSVQIREAFLASLHPDIIHVSSFFEGYNDDVVTSAHSFEHYIPVSVTVYDLIPLVYKDIYLDDPIIRSWYHKKIEQLRHADLFLTISEFSREDLIKYLDVPEKRILNISTAVDSHFKILPSKSLNERQIRRKYNLFRPFVMYTGGIDFRKNIEGLIKAYAALPNYIRKQHQLSIICSIEPDDEERLTKLASDVGLAAEDIIFTGFVSDNDLVALYNLCKLFVFPSLYEGFGMPLLEAMSCGAPVIAGNNSSLPEVVGCREALFDSKNIGSITEKLKLVLTDDVLRNQLKRHGVKRSHKFVWDKCAFRAIKSFELLCKEFQGQKEITFSKSNRLKLAYISPLPPIRSGISGYSVELLPALSKYYDIDVIVKQNNVSELNFDTNIKIRDVEWFQKNFKTYDRIIYQFGNSVFHHHMFGLLHLIPGVVDLHDFFLSGSIASMAVKDGQADPLLGELYNSHGYTAVYESVQTCNRDDIIWKYPCNFSVLQDSLGIIVHSKFTRKLAMEWYHGNSTSDTCAYVPLVRVPFHDITTGDRKKARRLLGFSEDEFIICSFGIPGETKLSHRLLQAWLHSDLFADERCILLYVGAHANDSYISGMHADIEYWGLSDRVQFTGWLEPELFNNYLIAADAAVQLRTKSRGEMSAAVLDCMNYALPTVVNANGSFGELPDDTVYKLPDIFSGRQLVEALELIWRDDIYRKKLGYLAKEYVNIYHLPELCAGRYFEAIERFYRSALTGTRMLTKTIASNASADICNFEMLSIADAVNRSIVKPYASKQLFLDISELSQKDIGTGIQRVVRNLLEKIIEDPPAGYRVEPIYATVGHGYRYARKFTNNFLGYLNNDMSDDPIDYQAGDFFLGLDLQPLVTAKHKDFFRQLRIDGVQVQFVVYDLLCVLMPKYFVPGAAEMFTRWLEVVGESDGAICISRSVARELRKWVNGHEFDRIRPFTISWFHLGAGLEQHKLSPEILDDDATLKKIFSGKPVFLMVGTVEPRKGHKQVLRAFESLWRDGLDVNLLVVGKQGWLVNTLTKKIHNHSECNKRLFWLENVTDETLDSIYRLATCLVAASEGEGYGLPIVEAAQYGLPVIARDIPVFREIGGRSVFYFKGNESTSLTSALQKWLQLYELGQHPCSKGMNWLTWEQSAEQLISRLGINSIVD